MALDRTWYNTLVDDDGSNLVGSVIDKADIDALMDAIDASLLPGTLAPTTTGTITAEPIPAGGDVLATYHNNATLKTIQGMVAGIHGQLWFHYSKGAGQVDFAHLHASGTALGKLKLFATTGLTSLAAGSGVMCFQYDATVTQWRLVFHEQGAWITAPFAAGNFTASGSMVLTADAGDVGALAYRLAGKTLTVVLLLNTLTLSGTASTTLNIAAAAYGGFTAAFALGAPTASLYDAGFKAGQILAGGAQLQINKSDSSVWTLGTNAAYVSGVIAFPVS